MTTATDHAALQSRIAEAHAEADAAWRALRFVPQDEWPARLEAWQKADARHAALIEAGLILTLGNPGDEDE